MPGRLEPGDRSKKFCKARTKLLTYRKGMTLMLLISIAYVTFQQLVISTDRLLCKKNQQFPTNYSFSYAKLDGNE